MWTFWGRKRIINKKIKKKPKLHKSVGRRRQREGVEGRKGKSRARTMKWNGSVWRK